MAKMGWYSWRVDLAACITEQKTNPLKQKTMIVGMDVSHDRRVPQCYGKSPGRLSCVGFVASWDDAYMQYHSWVAFQTKGSDRLASAKELMISAMNRFYEKNGCFPANVVIYRY